MFDFGVLAPLDENALPQGGHVVAEKRGNNPVQVAAILSLDILGQPEAFGPLIRVKPHFANCDDSSICYGVTNLRHDYAFFQSSSVVPQGFPRCSTHRPNR